MNSGGVAEPYDQHALDRLIAEARAARQAMHTLLERLRDDRLRWERERRALLHRTRLTSAQRRTFQGYVAGRPGSRE